ncbi:MAG: TMEM175 family protein [Puniceicoccaceae bacterium]
MEWTEERLSSLSTREGYRLRGESMTRIEVFSDAAFAFAVTMLVLSWSSIPQNFDDIIAAMKGIPSFAASFAIITVIWVEHRRWSQRFGLDDGISTLLTLSLVFVVLIYVYPLKLVMDLMFAGFSASWFPSTFEITSGADVAGLVAFFSTGFCVVALIQLGLYGRVKSMSKALCLNQLERLQVQKEQLILLVQAIAGFLSAAFAVIFMSSLGYLAGLVLALVPIGIPIATHRTRKKIRAIQAESSGQD